MIVNLSPEAILFLSEASSRANAEDKRLRVSIGRTGGPVGVTWLKYKVGEGMWSPAFFDTEDPYRDEPVTVQPRLSIGPDGKPVVTD